MKSKREPSLLIQYTLCGPPQVKYLREIWVRSSKRAKAADMPFTISVEDVENLFQDQRGRCDVTGIEFGFEKYPDAFVKYPVAPSIDRRDAAGGYTPDNVRLVCTAVNFGLGQWGQELYLRLARAAVAKAALKS